MSHVSQIPFPDALEGASLSLPGLEDQLDDSLLIGNGDINALVWTQNGAVTMLLTKNDVWDARLDTSNDPPLPTLARIKALASQGKPIADPILPEGVAWQGPDSYHSHPYPCPRACARLTLGDRRAEGPSWRDVRLEGELNAWERDGDATVMRIQGRKEASNGYAFGPLALKTPPDAALLVRLSGTQNARYYVDVMAPGSKKIFGTGWQETPLESEDVSFSLPTGQQVDAVILYTWTEDGALAENRFESVRLLGDEMDRAIDLDLPDIPSCPGRLDIRRGVAWIDGAPGSVNEATARALADRNVFMIQSPAQAVLATLDSSDLPDAASGREEGIEWIRQDIPGDLDWQGLSFAVAMAVRPGVHFVSIVTSLESETPVKAAIEKARAAADADPNDLIKTHEAVWDAFWQKSGISLDVPLLSQTWYRGLYFLRCVSKPGVLCPGLFASLTTDTPAWHGDYHTNYNIQQTFWGAYGANHPELTAPYDALIKDYLPRSQWLARQIFDMEGAYYPHVLFAYEPSDPSACKNAIGRQYIHHTWGMTLGVAGFSVQPLWWHYKYDPQEAFLRDVAYPPVKEVALFYAAFIEQCDGAPRAVLGPTVSPEHWGWTQGLERNTNCAFDIAMARYTLEAAIEGGQRLGCDQALIPRFKKAIQKLPEYPRHGEIVVDVAGAPPIEYNIAVPATPVFPGEVVTWWSSSEEKALFARTTAGLQWNGNNSTVMLAVSRARLSMPDTKTWIEREIEARLRPNGTLTLNRLKPHHPFNDFGHYTEQFGATLAVTELLIQSVGDIIRIFPAIPEECDVAFERLRTQGGFLVSAARKQGTIGQIRIESTAGGPCHLLSPWPATQSQRNADPWTDATPNADGIIVLDTGQGDVFSLRKDGATLGGREMRRTRYDDPPVAKSPPMVASGAR